MIFDCFVCYGGSGSVVFCVVYGVSPGSCGLCCLLVCFVLICWTAVFMFGVGLV